MIDATQLHCVHGSSKDGDLHITIISTSVLNNYNILYYILGQKVQ